MAEQILVVLGEGQVAEGEMEGLLRATERALSRDADQILVISDSQAGLKGIVSTAPRSGQFRAILYDKLVRGTCSYGSPSFPPHHQRLDPGSHRYHGQ